MRPTSVSIKRTESGDRHSLSDGVALAAAEHVMAARRGRCDLEPVLPADFEPRWRLAIQGASRGIPDAGN